MKRNTTKWHLVSITNSDGKTLPDCDLQDFTFSLDLVNARPPSGWVCVDTQLTCRDWNSKLMLTWKTTDEMGNDGVFYPSIALKGKVRDLLYLPQNIQELRCIVTAETKPEAIVLTKVGPLIRLRMMLYRTIRALFKHPREKRLRARVTAWRLLTDLRATYSAASRLRARTPALPYEHWIQEFDTLSELDRRRIRLRCRRLRAKPIISLAIAAHGVSAEDLAATIASLRAQLYPHWKLLIAADANCAAELKKTLQACSSVDQRIRVAWLPQDNNLETSANNNSHNINGEYLAWLSAGDRLAEHALYCIAAELETHPEAVLVYTDEDRLDAQGQRHTPNFKPDWNPQLLLSQNYLGGLCVYRAEAFSDAGGMHSTVNDAATYALNLRITAHASADEIRHIPLLLYHRGEPNSNKTVDPEAGKQVLREYLATQHIAAEVSAGDIPNSYRVHYDLPAEPPLISIIVPTRDKIALLQCCVDSIRKRSSYRHFEIVIVDNQSSAPDALAYLETLAGTDGITVLRYEQPFNYAAINNFAARHCRGEVLCLLNNDTEVITPGWMEEMLGLLYQPDVAVVGAKLYYSDDSIQHAGDLIGIGIADHAHAFLHRDNPGYQGRAKLAQDMSAVTAACLMVWKSRYEMLGGLNADDLPVAFNDVDFCLRVREAGWRVVWTPWAELYHHESQSRGADNTPEKIARMLKESNYMRQRWSHWLEHDPAYNPNLSQQRPDFSLSHIPPPRPW